MKFGKSLEKGKEFFFSSPPPFLVFGLQAISLATAGPAPLLPGATAARLGRSAQRAAPAQPARLLRSQPLPAGPAGQLFPPPSSRATRNRSGGRAATAPAPRASWARRQLLGLVLKGAGPPRAPGYPPRSRFHARQAPRNPQPPLP